MKNIIKKLLAPALALAVLPFMASCDTDDESNPTIKLPDSFVLNVPAHANDNVYDLANSETVNLKTSQPDYGFPVVTVYQVQVSLDRNFASEDPSVADNVVYTTLETSYTKADMDVNAVELNNAIVKMYQDSHGGADPSGIVMPAYIRLQAHVDNVEGSYCYSNVITLPKVVVSYVATLPSDVYVAGASVRGGTEAKELAPVYGNDGQFYGMVYMAAGSTLMWGDSKTPGNGYAQTSEVTDDAGAGLSEGTDGGIAFANAGWYVLYMQVSVANNQVVSKLTVYPGEAYVIGAVVSQVTWGHAPEGQLVAPADASGKWESPAFTAGGELRASIKVPGLDWWRTEFTLYKGSLYWRVDNIAENWAKDVGADYSVTCAANQKLYVDFDYDKGEVK